MSLLLTLLLTLSQAQSPSQNPAPQPTPVQQAGQQLEQENVIIFEPAFLFDGLFVRVDVLIKQGNAVHLLVGLMILCGGITPSQPLLG